MYISLELRRMGENPKWLAEVVGVSKVSISKYIRGRTFPENEIIERISKVFGYDYKTLDDLVMGYAPIIYRRIKLLEKQV